MKCSKVLPHLGYRHILKIMQGIQSFITAFIISSNGLEIKQERVSGVYFHKTLKIRCLHFLRTGI